MKIDEELLPNKNGTGDILKGKDLNGVTTAKIVGAEAKDFNGKKALQLTVSYRDNATKQNSTKKFSIGKNKIQLLVDTFGDETDKWNGKEILLVPNKTVTPDGVPTVAINVTPFSAQQG